MRKDSFLETLHLTDKHYKGIAKNILRMNNLPELTRLNIINEANKKFPQTPEFKNTLTQLDEYMFNDKEVFELSELPYAKGFSEQIFYSAVADYFLRNKIITK